MCPHGVSITPCAGTRLSATHTERRTHSIICSNNNSNFFFGMALFLVPCPPAPVYVVEAAERAETDNTKLPTCCAQGSSGCCQSSPWHCHPPHKPHLSSVHPHHHTHQASHHPTHNPQRHHIHVRRVRAVATRREMVTTRHVTRMAATLFWLLGAALHGLERGMLRGRLGLGVWVG
jgi:hypothetical protein